MKPLKNTKIFAAVVFLLLAYWPVSLLQFAMKYDIMDWFYPMRYLIGECLQNNVLPTWNPYINLGYPLHVDPQSGALYPLVWVIGYFLGYSPYTINFEFTLHIIFAFYGMKKLSQAMGMHEDVSILIGMSYACCGFFVGNAQHLSWVISAAWMPYVFYFYYRLVQTNSLKAAAGLALFAFLMLTGGYPAFIITVFYLLLIAFFVQVSLQVYKKQYWDILMFLLGNCFAALLFLLQGIAFLVFFIEALPFMVRTDALSLAEVQLLPFSPRSFISFILPFTTGGNTEFFRTDISMANGYFGLFTFLFCVLCFVTKPGWKTLALGFTGVLFLAIAMGDYFFLREWLYHYVPMMNMFRYPALFRVFALICFLLLAGLAIQQYLGKKENDPGWRKPWYLGLFVLVGLSGIFLFALAKSTIAFPEQFSAKGISAFIAASSNSNMVLLQAPIQAILFLAFLFIIRYRRDKFLKYIPFIIAFDLFLSVQLNMLITVVSEQKASVLQEKTSRLLEGFPIPRENVSLTSHYGNGEYYPVWYNNNILLKKIAFDGYNNFILKNFKQFNDSPGSIEKLKYPVLHWESSADPVFENTGQSIEIIAFSPTGIIAKVDTPRQWPIVFLQSDYPGWTVRLDGNTLPHYKKDDLFIAADIPAGAHRVEINFYPPNYLVYLGISTIAFLCALFLSIRKVKIPVQMESGFHF